MSSPTTISASIVNLKTLAVQQNQSSGQATTTYPGVNSNLDYYAVNLTENCSVISDIPAITMNQSNSLQFTFNINSYLLTYVNYLDIIPYINTYSDATGIYTLQSYCNFGINLIEWVSLNPSYFDGTTTEASINVFFSFYEDMVNDFISQGSNYFGIAIPSDFVNSATFSFVIRISVILGAPVLDINRVITSVVYTINDAGNTLATSSSIIANYPSPYLPSPSNSIINNVEAFINEVLEFYNDGNSPTNIFTYLAQFNYYNTVTDVYSIINTGSFINAILPSSFETYFVTDPLPLTSLSSITLFYLNQSCAQNACFSNIQFYVSTTNTVNFNGSENYYTLDTSPVLPICSNSSYPTSSYTPTSSCDPPIFTKIVINSTDELSQGGWSTFTGFNYLILVERISFPVVVSGICSYPVICPTQPNNYNLTCSQPNSPYNLYSSSTPYTVNFSVFPIYSS